MPAFIVATANPNLNCARPNCPKPRAILVVDGKRKRAKLCRSHVPRRYRPYLEHIGRTCQGSNFLGKACRSAPLLPGRVIAGVEVSGDYCLAHEPLLMEDGVPGSRAGLGSGAANGGAKRIPRKTELVLKMIEDAAADLISEQLAAALNAEKPVVVGNGAHAELEMAPDVAARLRAIDSLLDRLMGKAKITTEVIGGDGKTEAKRTPTSPDRAARVAGILAQAQAIQKPEHTGRRRSKPAQPAHKPEEAT